MTRGKPDGVYFTEAALLMVASWLLGAVFLMLLLMVLHGWEPQIPSMGFWTGAAVSAVFAVCGMARGFLASYAKEMLKEDGK